MVLVIILSFALWVKGTWQIPLLECATTELVVTPAWEEE
jgi:hypothetical protein